MTDIVVRAQNNETVRVLAGAHAEDHAVDPHAEDEDARRIVLRLKAFHPLASLKVQGDYVHRKGGWEFGVYPDEDSAADHPDWPVREMLSGDGRRVMAVIVTAPDGVQVSREE